MHKLANTIDQAARREQAVSIKDDSTNEIDELVRVLGSIIVTARDLPDEDHARAKGFILAAAI